MGNQAAVVGKVASGVIMAIAVLAAPARAQYSIFDSDAALQTFHERVDAYAALHRRLAPLPSADTMADPLTKLLTKTYLASAIRGSRPYAQQGDMFSPEIATLFRWMLADAIGQRDAESFVAELNVAIAAPHVMHPDVNETYTMASLCRLPVNIRSALPKLPPELDYRLAGRDLVLWDIYAGIVIDFVPDAVTSPGSIE
jgi:hypothetical protein